MDGRTSVNSAAQAAQKAMLLKEISLPHRQSRQLSGAERQARYAASGRQVACVIRDPAALDALEKLEATHGGVTAAVTYVLRESCQAPHDAPRDQV